MADQGKTARDRSTEGKDSGIPFARTDDPIEVDGPSPSENSRLRAATAIQSSVTPEDYTEADREQQVAAGTDGADRKKRGQAVRPKD